MEKIKLSDGREVYFAEDVEREIARLKKALGGKVENLKPREPKYNEIEQREIAERVRGGESKRSLSIEFGVSRATIGRYHEASFPKSEDDIWEILEITRPEESEEGQTEGYLNLDDFSESDFDNENDESRMNALEVVQALSMYDEGLDMDYIRKALKKDDKVLRIEISNARGELLTCCECRKETKCFRRSPEARFSCPECGAVQIPVGQRISGNIDE